MTTNTTRRIARFFALPIVSAAILAGALGMAGTASAGTYTPDNTPRPGIVATPNTYAQPTPGARHNHGLPHLQRVQPYYQH
ncbi:hypothetical protein A5765_09675 [Mycolicibacterium celeriflavum]|uniref:hypothetical protein n=1 Tax=Mycolicibacterium celeriflavum TaxID=1249101 RepID=UPI0007FED98B|nr:hypothetical protein [Mycolicibacterium celeriflavum]OBG15021.1 hypothetical protein A5765_09675 [Mycolicibacterium celeriflavum]